MCCTVPLSGAGVQAGPFRLARAGQKIHVGRVNRRCDSRYQCPVAGRIFMTNNDAAVLAKFVFVVFGLGLTGMVAQLIMLS
jgi:hypothetical protein